MAIKMDWAKNLPGVSALPDGNYNLSVVNGVGVATETITAGSTTLLTGDIITHEGGAITGVTPSTIVPITDGTYALADITDFTVANGIITAVTPA